MGLLLGIDFGNSSSVIAVAEPKEVKLVQNNDLNSEIPSVVSFVNGRRKLGTQGASSRVLHPTSTITQFKSLIGNHFRAVEREHKLVIIKDVHFVTSEDTNGGILIHVQHRGEEYRFKPVHILAMFLFHLKQMVIQTAIFSDQSRCVIGVPSYFTDEERIAYRDAAEIAGLEGLHLMHEGTAIALAYGFYNIGKGIRHDQSNYVIFVDVGHCDTQVTVVRFQGEEMHVLAHASDPNLGGRDFDKVLFAHFAQFDVRGNTRACVRLMKACESVKKELASTDVSQVWLENWLYDSTLSGSITKRKFEELSLGLLQRLGSTCSRALEEAQLRSAYDQSTYTVELVGSGSRIPMISSFLEEHLGRHVNRKLNAKECVARGCALQALLLSRNSKLNLHKVYDSLPFEVGFRAYNSITVNSSLLFCKGTVFPTTSSIVFEDMNETFNLDIIVRENDYRLRLTRCYKVGNFSVPIHLLLPKVEVKFSIDHFGVVLLQSATLSVMQQEVTSEHGQIIVTTRRGPAQALEIVEASSMGMTKHEMLEFIGTERTLADHDKMIEETQQRRYELECYLSETVDKLEGDKYADVLSSSEKCQHLKELHEVRSWIEENDELLSSDVYLTKLEDLKKIFSSFDILQKSSDECNQETRMFQDIINKKKGSAISLQKPEIIGAVHLECTRAEEWLMAWKHFLHLFPGSVDKSLYVSVIREKNKSINELFELIQRDYTEWCSTSTESRLHAKYPYEDGDPDVLPSKITVDEEQHQASPSTLLGLFSNPFKRHSKHSIKAKQRNFTLCSHGKYGKERGSDSPTSGSAHTVDFSSSSYVSDEDGTQGQRKMMDSRRRVCFRMESIRKRVLLDKYIGLVTELEIDRVMEITSYIEDIIKGNVTGETETICDTKINTLNSLLDSIEDRLIGTPSIIGDLLYCIFRYRVAVISSQNLLKVSINEECERSEEWLIEKMRPGVTSQKNVNHTLRSEIRQKINDLNWSCKQITEDYLLELEQDLKDYMAEIQIELQGRYKRFSTEAEKTTILGKIETISHILANKGRRKSEELYSNNLISLQQLIGPIDKRSINKEEIEALFQELLLRIQEYKTEASSIADSRLLREVEDECSETTKWVEKRIRQMKSDSTDDKILWSCEIQDKIRNLDMCCTNLVKEARPTYHRHISHGQNSLGNEASNPTVYFDIKIDKESIGKLKMKLFSDVAPTTVENFRSLCTGERTVAVGLNRNSLSYKGTTISHVVRGKFCRGGYDPKSDLFQRLPSFPHELSTRKSGRGALAMHNALVPGRSHGSSFVICFGRSDRGVDRKNVVFGEVIDGMDVLGAIEEAGTAKKTIVIADCGQIYHSS